MDNGFVNKDEVFEQYFNDPNTYYPVRDGFFDTNQDYNTRKGIWLLNFEEEYQIITKGHFVEIEPISVQDSAYFIFYKSFWEGHFELLKSNLFEFEKNVLMERQKKENEIADWRSFLNTYDTEKN